MRHYDVQFKGQIIHRNVSAEELASLVTLGEVSGLDCYAPTDRRTWKPVCQMVPVRTDSGEWEIRENTLSRPEPAPERKIHHNAAPPKPEAPTAPPPVGIYINQGPNSETAKPATTPDRGTPATLAIIGFSMCAVSVAATIGFMAPDRYHKGFAVAGMLIALLGVLLSSIGVQYAGRRMLPVVGVLLGMAELIVWAAFIILKKWTL